jgi:hypothetical protein
MSAARTTAARLGFLVVAALVLFGGRPASARGNGGCATGSGGNCSDVNEWCRETHVLICGYASTCCPGTICRSPDTTDVCDNDNAQCICIIHEEPAPAQ